jgi:hypothetical protein
VIINSGDIAQQWVRESVVNCQMCEPLDEFGAVAVCGWHENVTAAAKTLDKLIEERER